MHYYHRTVFLLWGSLYSEYTETEQGGTATSQSTQCCVVIYYINNTGLFAAHSTVLVFCFLLTHPASVMDWWGRSRGIVAKPKLLQCHGVLQLLTHWRAALMVISQSGHGSTGSSSGKCWSNTKAAFSDIHHIIVSASCLDHTLTSTWPQCFAFPVLLPTKLSFQRLFSASQAVRDVPNPPQLYFWVTTCQNSEKPSLIRKHVRTCWICFLQNGTCQQWTVGVSLTVKKEAKNI